MIKLALLEDPDVLLIDDIDVGLTPAETQTLLSELDATGRAVVAVCRDGAALTGASARTGGPAAPAALAPTAAPHGTLTSTPAPQMLGRAPSTSRSDVKVPFLSQVGVGR
ncbi:hypothetical protein ACFQZ4_32680 [Catellatospora coxensis]